MIPIGSETTATIQRHQGVEGPCMRKEEPAPEPISVSSCACEPRPPESESESEPDPEAEVLLGAECVGEMNQWLGEYEFAKGLANTALTHAPAAPDAFDVLVHETMFAMRATGSIPLTFDLPEGDTGAFLNVMLSGVTGQSVSLSEFFRSYYRNFLLQFKSLSPVRNSVFVVAGLLMERLFRNQSFRYICSYCGKSMKVIMGNKLMGSPDRCCQLLANIREILLVLLMIAGTYLSRNPDFQMEKCLLMKSFFHRRLDSAYFEDMEWIVLSQLRQKVVVSETDYNHYLARKVVQLTISRNYYSRICPICNGVCSDVIFNRVPAFI